MPEAPQVVWNIDKLLLSLDRLNQLIKEDRRDGLAFIQILINKVSRRLDWVIQSQLNSQYFPQIPALKKNLKRFGKVFEGCCTCFRQICNCDASPRGANERHWPISENKEVIFRWFYYCILNWAEVFSRITGSWFSVKVIRLRITVALSCLELTIRVVGRVQVG